MNRSVALFLLSIFAIPALAARPAWNDFYWRPADRHRDLSFLGSSETFYRTWFEDRLSIGLSFYTYSFTDADRPEDPVTENAFVGFINHLDEEESLCVAPVLTYRFTPNVRASLSYATYKAGTRNWNNGVGDGILNLDGPTLSVEGAYPMFGGELVPHGGLGLMFLSSDFSTDTWWHLGYLTEADWKAAGSPKTKLYTNRWREMRVDDEVAWFFQLGATWSPHPRFELDLSMRYAHIDPDAQFGYVYKYKSGKWVREKSGDFDISNVTFLLTTNWVF